MSDLPEQMMRQEHVSTTGRLRFEIDDIPEPCDTAGRLCHRPLSELGYSHERKPEKSTRENSIIDKKNYIISLFELRCIS